MDEASRKRPRTAIFPSMSSSATGATSTTTTAHTVAGAAGNAQQQQHPGDNVALDHARAVQLRKESHRNAVLNDLLRVTSAHDKNYALSSDEVLKELVRIVVYDCLGWHQPNLDFSDPETPPVLRSQPCWIEPPTKQAAAWAEHWKRQLGRQRSLMGANKLQTLEVVLVVIRNLSFVGANLRFLAYSPQVIHMLVGCLYEGTDTYYGTEDTSTTTSTLMSYSAIHTLVNLSPYLDVSGQRLCSDRLFYKPVDLDEGPKVPESNLFGQAVGGHWGWGGLWLAKRLDTKEDALSDVSRDFVLSLSSDYLIAVWSIFPALAYVLTNPKSPRSVVLLALDLLQELINNARAGMVGNVQREDDPDKIPTLRQILVNMPDSLLERLLNLLYIPRLGPDSLEYLDPVNNVVTRVTTLKLLMGYDATVDTEVRDRVLEVLVPLMELDSPRMAARMGKNPQGKIRTKLYDSVIPILTTNVGRQEASILASQFFRELNMAPENQVGFQYVQERLVELASRDARVSTLVWNHLYVTRVKEESEDDEQSTTDDSDDDDNNIAAEESTVE